MLSSFASSKLEWILEFAIKHKGVTDLKLQLIQVLSDKNMPEICGPTSPAPPYRLVHINP
jgi:hypothetical protein